MATWAAYRALRGTLNLGMRMEFLFGLSDWRSYSASGGKRQLESFLRYHEQEPEEVTLETIAKMFRAPYEVKKNGI